MSPFKLVLIVGAALAFVAPALAGTNRSIAVGVKSGGRTVIGTERGSWVEDETGVRVNMNLNFFVPAPSGDSDEVRKARDDARRSIYEMARRECDLLREVLAKDCRLEELNIGTSQTHGPYQPGGFTVNGTVSMQITLK